MITEEPAARGARPGTCIPGDTSRACTSISRPVGEGGCCICAQLLEDVQEESGKYGRLQGIAVPRPPPGTPQDVPNRVFLIFEAPDEARKAKDVFDGRSFDGNSITAKFVAEEDFERAQRGEWPPMDLPGQAGGSALPPPPGFPAGPIGQYVQ